MKLVCQECGKGKLWSLFARDVERGSCKACRLVAVRQTILMKLMLKIQEKRIISLKGTTEE